MTDKQVRMVPEEPTEAMIGAYFDTCRRHGFLAHINATAAWTAMLAAAPSVQPDREVSQEAVLWIREAVARIRKQLNDLTRPFDNVVACEADDLRTLLAALTVQKEEG